MGFAPILGAIAGVGLTAGSVYQGQQAAQGQRRALAAQRDAQAEARARANAEVRRREQEQRRLNRRSPDISELLLAEREAAARGPGSTLLTSQRGRGQNAMTLGATSLLGGL